MCLPTFTYRNVIGVRLCCGRDRQFVLPYCPAAGRGWVLHLASVRQPGVIRTVSSLRLREDSAMSFCIAVFMWTHVISFSVIPRRGSVGSSGKFMFSFLRNCQRGCQSSHIILCSHQQQVPLPFCPHPQHLVRSVSLFHYHHHRQRIVLFHCGFSFIPLMTNGVSNIFMCLFGIHISSLLKCYLNLLSIFELLGLMLLSRNSSLYILETSPF